MVSFQNTAQLIMLSCLSAVAPESLVYRHVKGNRDNMLVGQSVVETADRPIVCLGAGKACARMGQALSHIVKQPFSDGTMVTPEGYVVGSPGCRARAAGHPIPDERSHLAADEALAMAHRWSSKNPLVLATISGGASALWCSPREGLQIEQKIEASKWLLASGLPIEKVNAIRCSLSAIKGGRLAAAFEGAEIHVLVLSDIPGDRRLGIVGSGPFHYPRDNSTYAAQAIQEARVPPPVWLADAIANTPPAPAQELFERVHHHLIGGNHDAVVAAAVRAAQLNLHPIVETKALTGEAAVVGRVLAEMALGQAINRPTCLVFGGETTVTLTGKVGKGGRNQEMALSFAIAAAGRKNIALLAFSTDGIDGVTDAAGAFVDGNTISNMKKAGIDPQKYLDEHNSNAALAASDSLLHTGPTGTNVADLAIVFIA